MARASAKINGSAVSGRPAAQAASLEAEAAVSAAGARAISAAAARAACRATRRAHASQPRGGGAEEEAGWLSYAVARRTVARLQRALAARGSEAAAGGGGANATAGGTDAAAGGCHWLLDDGGGDLFLCIFETITDTQTLRGAACVSWEWATRLARSRSAAVDGLWRAATLAAPRGKLSVGGAIRSTRPGDRLRLSGPGLVRKGEAIRLPHALLLSAAPGIVLSGAITLEGSGFVSLEGSSGFATLEGGDFGAPHAGADGSGGSAGGGGAGGGGSAGGGARRGVLSGLTLRHFYDTAITVLGGHWVLEGCEP